jgi:2,2-dialkylglycine decarboxylase (pyruvate)
MCATIGHNHPAIVDAVNRAGKKAFHFFSGMIPEVVVELAQTLARDWLPVDIKRTIFINTGSEASEVALRMAKMYTDGYEVLALGGSWHGITGGAGSVSMASDRKGYGVPAPGVFVIPEPNAYRPYIPGATDEQSALATLDIALKMFDMQSAGRGAAIIVEPVISAGGVLVPPRSFMQALRKAADERGMLLIFDEAQTAFGRIGTRTGSEYFDVVPDIMTMSKTLGGGLPLAAVATTARIEEALHDKHFTFYTSHVSDGGSRPGRPEGDRRRAAHRALAQDGRLPAQPLGGPAAALRGDRRRARPRPPARRRTRARSFLARSGASARRADDGEVLRERSQHEYSAAARARLGLANRAAAHGLDR